MTWLKDQGVRGWSPDRSVASRHENLRKPAQSQRKLQKNRSRKHRYFLRFRIYFWIPLWTWVSIQDCPETPGNFAKHRQKLFQRSPRVVTKISAKMIAKFSGFSKQKCGWFLRKISTRGRHDIVQNPTKLATKLAEQADKSPPGDQTSCLELGGGSGCRVSGCGWRPRRFELWSLPGPRDLQKFRHQRKLQTCHRTSFLGADKLQTPDRGSASPLDYTKPDYSYRLYLIYPPHDYTNFNSYSQNQPFIAHTFT